MWTIRRSTIAAEAESTRDWLFLQADASPTPSWHTAVAGSAPASDTTRARVPRYLGFSGEHPDKLTVRVHSPAAPEPWSRMNYVPRELASTHAELHTPAPVHCTTEEAQAVRLQLPNTHNTVLRCTKHRTSAGHVSKTTVCTAASH